MSAYNNSNIPFNFLILAGLGFEHSSVFITRDQTLHQHVGSTILFWQYRVENCTASRFITSDCFVPLTKGRQLRISKIRSSSSQNATFAIQTLLTLQQSPRNNIATSSRPSIHIPPLPCGSTYNSIAVSQLLTENYRHNSASNGRRRNSRRNRLPFWECRCNCRWSVSYIRHSSDLRVSIL